jgi:hypothetical protein
MLKVIIRYLEAKYRIGRKLKIIRDIARFPENVIENIVFGIKYFKQAHWILKGNCIFILFLIVIPFTGHLQEIVPFIKYLWGQHWAFRINPFFILYLVIGPLIIWRIRPQASVLERYSLIFIAIVLSFLYYFFGIGYMKLLDWFERDLCSNLLVDNIFEKKKDVCSSSTQGFFLIILFIISAIFVFSPFCGFTRLAWRIYHRKTIKEMGPEFGWRWFDNITIFLSLMWMQMLFIPVIGPIFAFITFFILYIIGGIIYSICNVF